MSLSLATALLAAAAARAETAPAAPSDATPTPRLQDVPPEELPHWSGALTLGGSLSAGNTENETASALFNAVRRGEEDRWTFDAYSNYGRTTDEEDEDGDGDLEEVTRTNANNHGGSIKYDRFFTKKLYGFGTGLAKVDHVADLNLRYTAGAGAGYQWKETEKLKWGTEAGLSYVDEDFEDDTADADYVAARLASNLTWQISPSSSFEQITEVLPSLEDSEDLLARFDNRLKMVITGKWIAQVQYVLDFDDSVPPGNKEADHRIVFSLGWSFGS